MTKIEEIARAIWRSLNPHLPDEAFGYALENNTAELAARAALLAMKNPTDDMNAAADNACRAHNIGDIGWTEQNIMFNAMIDKALERK